MMSEETRFTRLTKALGCCASLADCPCIGVCSVTQWGDDRCRGCGRTATELKDWGKYSNIEKKLINNMDENVYSELLKLKSQINRD